MPLYEYACEACDHRFEVIQKFSDPPVETCPVCGGAVHKLQSAPAFQFKGTGWYVTDYARAGKPESKAEGAEESKAEAKTETKTESPDGSREGSSSKEASKEGTKTASKETAARSSTSDSSTSTTKRTQND